MILHPNLSVLYHMNHIIYMHICIILVEHTKDNHNFILQTNLQNSNIGIGREGTIAYDTLQYGYSDLVLFFGCHP